MTIERAKQLGIYTAWEVVSCAFCSNYAKIQVAEEQNNQAICPKCKKEADKQAARRSQQDLFENAQSLF